MQQLKVAGSQRTGANNTGPAISILIVDDYEASRSALEHLISRRWPKVNVHVTDDYNTVPEFCVKNDIDIVITDMLNASLNTHGALQNFTSIKKDIKLVITTGSSDKNDIAAVSGINSVCLLQKPIEYAELVDVIDNFIRDILF